MRTTTKLNSLLADPTPWAGRFLKTHEAAELIQISDYQLREIVRRGKLRAHKRKGSRILLFKVQDLLDFLRPTRTLEDVAVQAGRAR